VKNKIKQAKEYVHIFDYPPAIRGSRDDAVNETAR